VDSSKPLMYIERKDLRNKRIKRRCTRKTIVRRVRNGGTIAYSIKDKGKEPPTLPYLREERGEGLRHALVEGYKLLLLKKEIERRYRVIGEGKGRMLRRIRIEWIKKVNLDSWFKLSTRAKALPGKRLEISK